jgi:hypothetical protein
VRRELVAGDPLGLELVDRCTQRGLVIGDVAE